METETMSKITLATLPEATAQQVFDQVATHLLAQGRKSEDEKIIALADLPPKSYTSCAYRGPDGLKCAVGFLMSDAEYNEQYEGYSWEDLLPLFCELPVDHAELISSLQAVHDNSVPDVWRTRLVGVAKMHNLDYSCTKV